MTAAPTGRLVGGDLRLERIFDAPAAEIWAAVTEPQGLARWIGYYEEDPASGGVDFYMTAEGDDPEPAPVVIEECRINTVLQVRQLQGDEPWRLRLEIAESAGRATLTFTHLDIAADQIEMIGPGWDYYLDRLVASQTGRRVETIDFDADYYPAMAAYYRSQVTDAQP